MAEKNKRKTINKKTRFEVFKRDNFTCQYCGRSAPEVILEVDHINPISNGGDNNILNLITSCRDCNRGKGKRKITDNEEIKLQIEQLKELNQKREQLEMLLKWKKELENFNNEQVDKIENLFLEKTGFNFSNHGKERISKEIKKYGFNEVYESTEISIKQYFKNDSKTAYKVFDYIGRICYVRQQQKENPCTYEINYLIKIVKNNLLYFDEIKLQKILKQYFKKKDFEELKNIFASANNWTELKNNLLNYYELEE